MPNNLIHFLKELYYSIEWLNPIIALIVGSFPVLKFKAKDLDLVVVSNYFESVYKHHRKRLIHPPNIKLKYDFFLYSEPEFNNYLKSNNLILDKIKEKAINLVKFSEIRN